DVGADDVDQQRDGQQHQCGVHENRDLLGAGLGEVIGQQGGQGVGGGKERDADPVGVADEHGQRHGLAQGAAESQDDAAEDAAGGGGQDDGENGLPTGGAETVGGHAQFGRHGGERIAADGGDGGQNHDGQYDDRGQHAGAAEVGAEQREPAHLQVQPIAGRADQRYNHENAPQAIDDAGDGSQEFDQIREQILDLLGQLAIDGMEMDAEELEESENEFTEVALAEEDGGGDAKGGADDQREERTVEGAPDFGQDAELAGIGIPDGSGHETGSVLAHGRDAGDDDLQDDENDADDGEPGETVAKVAERPVDQQLQPRRRLGDLGLDRHDGWFLSTQLPAGDGHRPGGIQTGPGRKQRGPANGRAT